MKKSKRKTNSASMRAMAEIVSDTEHLSVEKIQAVLPEKAAKGIILQYVYCCIFRPKRSALTVNLTTSYGEIDHP